MHFMFVVVIGLCHPVACLIHLCPLGTFLWTPRSGPEICLRCTEGVNFMPLSWHSHRACFNCTKIQDPALETLVAECNRTHDAVILCRPGYYRRKARNSRQKDFCKKCYECENPTLPCHDVYDTVCCGPNYEAVLNNDGVYECKELSIFCQQGQYFDTNTEQCRRCPPGTYMTQVNHSNTACNICQTIPNSESHQVMLRPCNSTHPTITDCEDGYFKDHDLEQTMGEVICLPCRNCSDPKIKMAVTDDDLECRHQVKNHTNQTRDLNEAVQNCTVCGEVLYLSHNASDRTATSLPCNPGTCMDMLNHIMNACKNSTDFKGDHLLVLCQHNTDTCARKSQAYRWSLMITTLLPAITVIIIMCWKRDVNIKFRGYVMKIGDLINAHLVLVCLLLAVPTFSPEDMCLWSVVSVALLYTLVIIIINTLITFRLLQCKLIYHLCMCTKISRYMSQCTKISVDKTTSGTIDNIPADHSLVRFTNQEVRPNKEHGGVEIIILADVESKDLSEQLTTANTKPDHAQRVTLLYPEINMEANVSQHSNPGNNMGVNDSQHSNPGHNTETNASQHSNPGHDMETNDSQRSNPGHNIGANDSQQSNPGHNTEASNSERSTPGHNMGANDSQCSNPGHNIGGNDCQQPNPGHNTEANDSSLSNTAVEKQIKMEDKLNLLKIGKTGHGKSATGSSQDAEKERNKKLIQFGNSLKFVLIGKTGEGKSSTGNSLLNRKVFKTSSSCIPGTLEVDFNFAQFGNDTLMIVDTPGLDNDYWDKYQDIKAAVKHLESALAMCYGSIDVFLFVIRCSHRFTAEERRVVETLKQIIGDSFLNHVVVVATGGDYFEACLEEEQCTNNFQAWCREQTGELRQLYDDCQGRFVLFNNREKNEEKKHSQIQEIVQLAHGLRDKYGSYTSQCFKDAERKGEKFILEQKLTLEVGENVPLLFGDVEKLHKQQLDREIDKLRARFQKLGFEISAQDKGLGVLTDLKIQVKKAEVNLDTVLKLQGVAKSLEQRSGTFLSERAMVGHRIF